MIVSASHVSVRTSDYRIIRRDGAVVPFCPSKVAMSMVKAFYAIAAERNWSSSDGRPGSRTASVDAGSTESSGAESGGSGGGSGGDGDGDGGDGDGDGDGPRRRYRKSNRSPSPRTKVKPRSGGRQRVPRTSSDQSAPHRRALIALLCLTTLLLLAAVVFVLLDCPSLADKTLIALGSVPLLALRLVKPK